MVNMGSISMVDAVHRYPTPPGVMQVLDGVFHSTGRVNSGKNVPRQPVKRASNFLRSRSASFTVAS